MSTMIRCHSTWNELSLVYVIYIYTCLIVYLYSHVTQLTVLGMKHPEESISLQAVEFWSTVCEEEIELSIEAAEVRYFGPMFILSLLNNP